MKASQRPSTRQTILEDGSIGFGLGVIAGAIIGAERAELLPHALMVEYYSQGVAAQAHQVLDDMIRVLSKVPSSDPTLDFVLDRKIAMLLGGIQGAVAGVATGVLHSIGRKASPARSTNS